MDLIIIISLIRRAQLGYNKIDHFLQLMVGWKWVTYDNVMRKLSW